MNYVPLSLLDLALAAALVLVNAAVSLAFSLRMERTLALSAIRMVVQLALVALMQRWIFAQTSRALTLLLASVMVGSLPPRRMISLIASVISSVSSTSPRRSIDSSPLPVPTHLLASRDCRGCDGGTGSS